MDNLLNQAKDAFILNEIRLLTIQGAFQRANIYKNDISKNKRNNFKDSLFEYIDEEILADYKTNVQDDSNHIRNIDKLSSFIVDNFSRIVRLEEGKFIFGISQKILNLYLKYLWCFNQIKLPPPHFPVDRIIQKKLKIPYSKIVPWTKINNKANYLEVINRGKEVLREPEKNGFKKEEFDGIESIAELELYLFKRNNVN